MRRSHGEPQLLVDCGNGLVGGDAGAGLAVVRPRCRRTPHRVFLDLGDMVRGHAEHSDRIHDVHDVVVAVPGQKHRGERMAAGFLPGMAEIQRPQPRPVGGDGRGIEVVLDGLRRCFEYRALPLHVAAERAGRGLGAVTGDDLRNFLVLDVTAFRYRRVVNRHQDFGRAGFLVLEMSAYRGDAQHRRHRPDDDAIGGGEPGLTSAVNLETAGTLVTVHQVYRPRPTPRA